MRDEFSQQTKRTLADRVAWKCSFPGCREITIGPGSGHDEHVLRLGVAAHISAASEGGPRYNPDLTTEERKAIQNGIWLCTKHGDLIDKDFTEYSADTLRQWKAQAEAEAHHNLTFHAGKDNFLTTLIGIGSSIICESAWKTLKSNVWTFSVGNFIHGSKEMLFEYMMNFDSLSYLDKYLILERQGDGRVLDSVAFKVENEGSIIQFVVKEKFPSQDPHSVSGDIALGEDGDISFFEGDFEMVTGIDAARQAIRLTLSSSFGEWADSPLTGSYFSYYFNKYKSEKLTLQRLLKVEITRLLSIPIHGGYPPSYEPQLPFLKRVLSVEVLDLLPINKQIPVSIRGEWGNGETFEETFKIFV